jgi:hypothetical protein
MDKNDHMNTKGEIYGFDLDVYKRGGNGREPKPRRKFAVQPTCGNHLLLEFPSPAAPNNDNLSFMPAHCVYNNCFERWEKEKWKVTQLRRLSVLPHQAFSPRFCFDYIPQHTNLQT